MFAIRVRVLLACLFIGSVACPGRVYGKDTRIEAARRVLLSSYDGIPHEIVVAAVVDPTLGDGDRYELLCAYLGAQRSIKGDRAWMREMFLPKLEKMYEELGAEDTRSLIQILRGISYIYRDRDSSDMRMIQFLRQQLRTTTLSPAKREACKTVLFQLQGREAMATGTAWLEDEQQLLELSKKGQFAEMYKLGWSIVVDANRAVGDRVGALRYVNELLVRPTGVTFEQMRQAMESACLGSQDPVLAEALARSAMRAAFLASMQLQDVQAVLARLKSSSAPVARQAAETLFAEMEIEKDTWVCDPAEYAEEADRLVQSANLDANGRAGYRKLTASSQYRDEPVGAGGRWWILGKFLWNQQAVPAAIEAFGKYLQTRSPSSEADGRLREVVHLMRLSLEGSERDSVEFWAQMALRARGQTARAFVTAMIEELQGPTKDTRSVVAIGRRVLEKGPRPETAEAVIRLIPFSTADLNVLAERGHQAKEAKQASLMLAAALAREGKYEESVKYVDTSLDEPLPGVPLFRVVGLADCLFAAGKYQPGEALVRSLLRRNIDGAQSVNLLVYLMTRYQDASKFEDATRIQTEMFQSYAAAEPEAISTALGKCLAAMKGKGDPRAEVLTTRLLCQVVNGETYATRDGSTPQESLRFWQALLNWSQDHKQTESLSFFADGDDSSQADLARVLLARAKLDQGDLSGAAAYLGKVKKDGENSALAGKERLRLQVCSEREAKLASAVGTECKGLAETASKEQAWPVAIECYLLLAEFAGDSTSGAQALSEAVRCSEAGGLTGAYKAAIESRLSALEASPAAGAQETETLRALRGQLDKVPAPTTRSASTALVANVDGPLADAYGTAMYNLGTAFRNGGRFERAVACFHKGFERAPFTAAAPRSLQEEAWTLRFYMGQVVEADEVFRQIVAIYPTAKPGQIARTRLRVHYEGTKGKHPE